MSTRCCAIPAISIVLWDHRLWGNFIHGFICCFSYLGQFFGTIVSEVSLSTGFFSVPAISDSFLGTIVSEVSLSTGLFAVSAISDSFFGPSSPRCLCPRVYLLFLLPRTVLWDHRLRGIFVYGVLCYSCYLDSSLGRLCLRCLCPRGSLLFLLSWTVPWDLLNRL